jgi:heme oxygenase (mycobilin-producing)
VLVVTRFRLAPEEQEGFLGAARAALAALAERPGWRGGRVARATDAADTWLILTEWESVGAYRRSLGGFDVKLHATPLLARAVDEPSAFEVLYDSETGLVASDRAADADSVAVGEAAGPGAGWMSEHP